VRKFLKERSPRPFLGCMKTALVSFVLAVTATACASSIEPIEATHVRHVADVEAPAAVEDTGL
jgi:hypothetical protein